MRSAHMILLILGLCACDLNQLGLFPQEVDWRLHQGPWGDPQRVEEMPDANCIGWGVAVIRAVATGPAPKTETHEAQTHCAGDDLELGNLESGDYELRVEAQLEDGRIAFFAEQDITVRPFESVHEVHLVPLMSWVTLSVSVDGSGGDCEETEIDSITGDFVPQPAPDGGYPTANDLGGASHQLTGIGEFMEAMGMAPECLIHQMSVALNAMWEPGYNDDGTRAAAIDGFTYVVTVFGALQDVQTHASESVTVQVPPGTWPPEDLGVFCLDVTGTCG